MSAVMETKSENASFGGVQGVYSHASDVCGCEMTFAVYLPPQIAEGQKIPVLWYLSGLTCTHENAMTKAGAQGWAAEQGIALIFPDTSPRGDRIADDPAYDLGQGAGFYVNATQDPWAANYRMWDYIVHELPELVFEHFPLDRDRQGITGHSMGGHGALTIAMTHPEIYRSLSAISPIANPSDSDWGRKQFTAYLGEDEATWAPHDASILMRDRGYPDTVLIDQGAKDQFLDLLKPEALAEAAASRQQPTEFRLIDGYDHSYFYVASVIEDHIRFHAARLRDIP
ncbi:S-formylglutathione hydrolase [Paracoccus caeni]|uniref:S-formylglutathione hydrolase n=2 Tax=Paracoccus caeni TaxID=657651 RepID=A0A934SID1_9RHOB|nr:S-formylglutathione hydrolase [Paracoccus caeni]MBK4218198.1 S-formylglutathione hydrolase [Paracoccus caeni]